MQRAAGTNGCRTSRRWPSARITAAAGWAQVEDLTRLLFTEPSPAPAKYWLARTGVIASAEVRLPMVEVSPELAARLDQEIQHRTAMAQSRVA